MYDRTLHEDMWIRADSDFASGDVPGDRCRVSEHKLVNWPQIDQPTPPNLLSLSEIPIGHDSHR
jgi:hypothetical protein